ncbi:transglutaminase domain-containing protein [Paraburkholderia fungorum]|uniref:transglutaminase domain-containing protein n=1 Tax=Paraburkholderia fungorum TaxID=134537 RepID=UPI0038BA202F
MHRRLLCSIVAITVIDSVCPSRGEPSSLTIQGGVIVRPVVAAVESTPPAAAVIPAAAQPEPGRENASEAAQDAFDPGIERLRSATWWEANRKLRPQLAQVGDLMFVATSFEGETRPSAEGASRVQRLRDAMRAHRQLKPAGWNRLVTQVRDARAKAGDYTALTLANALINEIRYRDGTDGSYYPPARFFAESGVCKDFAVAKYLLLREAGFDASQLRLVSLAPRYNNTPDDWHVMLVVQADGMAAPVALDSPAPLVRTRIGEASEDAVPTDTVSAADTASKSDPQAGPAGPSALLAAILAGRKPADAVLRAPSAGPAVVTLGACGQAERPLAVVFNEQGSLSFEREAPVGTHRLPASKLRGARAIVADGAGQSWSVDSSGVFPKWQLTRAGGAAPLSDALKPDLRQIDARSSTAG